MKKTAKESTSPASQATLALTLLLGIGTPLFALANALYFPFFGPLARLCRPTVFAFIVMAAALLASLGLYGYWSWKNFLFYRTMLNRRWLAGALAAALALAGALWSTGLFYYPGALIPSCERRYLYLDGEFIWAALAVLYFFAGWCLPLAVSVKQARSRWMTASVALCGSVAIVFSILALGMFSNPFKYFSLSASCDRSSPEWSFPYAIESFAGIALLFAVAASACRIALYSRLSGVPFHPEIRSALKRGIWICLTVLILLGTGSFAGTLLFQSWLRRSPEYQAMMELRKFNSGNPDVAWKNLQPLRLPELDLHLARFTGFRDGQTQKRLELLLEQHPKLTKEADLLCMRKDSLPVRFYSPEEYPWTSCLHSVEHLQAFRLLLALERGDFAEASNLQKLLRNLVMTQSNFFVLTGSSSTAIFWKKYLDTVEAMVNFPSLPLEELRELRQTMPELYRQLEYCLELTPLGLSIANAVPLEQMMTSRREGVNFKNWSYVIPGLWCSLNHILYHALTAPEMNSREKEDLGRQMKRAQALEQAIDFLLEAPGALQPPEQTGTTEHHIFFFDHDKASKPVAKLKHVKETGFYRQFGSGDGGIRLLKKQ